MKIAPSNENSKITLQESKSDQNFITQIQLQELVVIQKSFQKSRRSSQHRLEFDDQSGKETVQGDQKSKEFSSEEKKEIEDSFNADEIDEGKKLLKLEIFQNNEEMILKIKNYQPQFRWAQFLEFTFYHLVYFCILGPLCQLLFFYIPGSNLVKSLLFNKITGVGIFQFMQFSMNFVVVFIYFFYQSKNIYFYGEVITMFLGMLFRCMVIGIKYATFDPQYIKIIKAIQISQQLVRKKNFLGNWGAQDYEIVFEEIHNQIGRFQIDEGLLYLEFTLPLNEKKKLEFAKLLQNFKNVYEKQNHMNSKKFPPTNIKFLSQNKTDVQDDYESYYSYVIITDLIQEFQKQNSKLKAAVQIFSMLYSIFKALLPNIMRGVEGKSAFGYSWQDYTFIACMATSTFLCYFPILAIILVGIIDISRLNFLQVQLTMMLAPRKLQELDDIKLFPTVNLTSVLVLKAWALTRKICFDYGKSYNLRLQANAALALIYCVIGLAFLIGNLFSAVSLSDNAQLASIFIDTFCLGVIFMILLFQAAQLNDKFNLNMNILRENKTLFNDYYTYADIYFTSNFQTQNVIQKQIIKQLGTQFQDDIDKIKEHLSKIVLLYEQTINDIEIEQNINPFRILGVKVTMPMLSSISTALVSSIGTVAVAYFKLLVQKN